MNVHRRLAAGQLGNLVTQGLDGGGGTNKILIHRALCAAGVALQLQRAAHQFAQVIQFYGLADEIEGARLKG